MQETLLLYGEIMNGFVRVAAITPKTVPADVGFNTEQIIRHIEEAKKTGAELVVFPELALCGYTVGDLVLQRTLLDKCENALQRIAESTDGVVAVVGMPARRNGRLFDIAAVVGGGSVLGAAAKRNVKNRNAFSAYDGSESITLCGQNVPFGNLVFESKSRKTFTFCVEIGDDMNLVPSPSEFLAAKGANIICNPSASAETAGAAEKRRMLVKAASAKLVAAYIYAGSGCGESSTDCVFAGHRIIAENGEIIAESSLFTDGPTVIEIDTEKTDFCRMKANVFSGEPDGIRTPVFETNGFVGKLIRRINPLPFLPKDERGAEFMITLQSAALKRRMEAAHSDKLVIGVSGGLDSALALSVSVRAAKSPKDVIAITMPCFGTGSRTLKNARLLCEALDVTFKEIPIKDSVALHFKDIGHDIKIKNSVYENAQARERMQILMDVANEVNGLVVGTGDMSELALGWTTYNGDHMASYGVNASVPKTLVKYLVLAEAQRLGEKAGEVLRDIAETEISPELLPSENGKISQKTEDILGRYEYHDFILYCTLQCGFAPKKVLYLALNAFGEGKENEIRAAMKVFYPRFFSQQFKRSSMPDGVRVGDVSLSPRGDWEMPSDASAALWLEEVSKL